MADSTAMAVDFLRARLLSERSVSRASKERADELAKRVAELEDQVRAVTAQRRQAERAAAEVLAVLESQGFGGHPYLSDDSAQDSGEEDDDGKRRGSGGTGTGTGEDGEPAAAARAKGDAEDALSGSGSGSGSGTAQPGGGLSWKGRSVSPRKARQPGQRHRRYLLSSDSSPKYRMGQSCRKNKRRVELIIRSVATEDDGGGGAGGSQKGRRDGSSDFTDDGLQADMDGEVGVGGDERSSGAGSGGGVGGGGQYVMRYEKDGEMERVLERQAELIGQYEEEERAQREWEKQYNENRNTDKADAEVKSTKKLPSANTPSAERLPDGGSLSESLQHGARRRGEQTSSISAPGSSDNSTATRQDQNRGDQVSDGDSGYSTNARCPPKHGAIIRAPSETSPSSDTLNSNSKVSGWSSSQFHDCSADDSQLDTQSSSYPPASSCSIADIETVLQALQRARISLSARLSKSKPVPPNQVTLALPAPGDEHREYDDDDGDSYGYGEKLGGSSPAALQEMLALPAPEDYHEREEEEDSPLDDDAAMSHAEKASSSSLPREETLALPAPGDDYRMEIEGYMKIPAATPGLFRLPIDSFPVDEKMFSGTACGSGFTLRAAAAAARHATSIFSNPPAASSCGAAFSSDGSGFPSTQGIGLQGSASALPLVPASGRCISVATPDFTVGNGSTPFVSGIPGLQDMNRGTPLANADLFVHAAAWHRLRHL